MSTTHLNFQYCPKVVIFNDDHQILLCKRKGELDYDGVFSFPGGKRETSDISIEEGIHRELSEELGNGVFLSIYRLFCIEKEYQKKAGNIMILPHYLGHWGGGKIKINPEEYSEYRWFSLDEMSDANIIETVAPVCQTFWEFQQTEFYKKSQEANSFIISTTRL